MKTVTILGSTGSVGRQVLATISQHPDAFKVVGLSAYTNEALLREQIEKFNPTHYYFPSGAVEVQSSLFDFLEDEKTSKCLTSLEELAAIPSDIVVLAVTGIAGLWAAVATLKRGGTLAIANKETIVCAGRHLKALEKIRRKNSSARYGTFRDFHLLARRKQEVREKSRFDGKRRRASRFTVKRTCESQSGRLFETSRVEYGKESHYRLRNAFQQRA